MAEQPVAEKTESEAKPSEEAKSAPDLEELLSQYDEEVKSDEPKQEKQPEPTAQMDKALFQMGKKEAIGYMIGDMPESVGEMLFSHAEAKSQGDPRIARAWSNRFNDPSTFKAVFTALGEEARSILSNVPDKGATEDRDAVTAAVRSANTRAADPDDSPSARDIASMNDAEFFAFKRKSLKK